MLNFLRSPCSDADLFGYLVQCAGGTLNLSEAIGESGFSKDNLLRCIENALKQRGRKIDDRQRSLIQHAVQTVVFCSRLEPQPKVSESVERFAEMLKEGGVDFNDPSVVQFREELADAGIFFKF